MISALKILRPLEEVTTGKPPDQDSFQVSPQVVRIPNRATYQILQNCLEMMTSGNEMEQTDRPTSQSNEGCGSSNKEGAQEEKTRDRERDKGREREGEEERGRENSKN